MESTSEAASKTVGDERANAEDLPEQETIKAEKQLVVEEEVKVTLKRPIEEDSSKTETTGNENKEIEESKPISGKQIEISEDVEEEEEEELEEESDDDGCDLDTDTEKDANQEITKESAETRSGDKKKTTTVTTVGKLTPEGTETVVTTSSVIKEKLPAETTAITAATPTSEEVTAETVTNPTEKDASGLKQEKTNEQKKPNEVDDSENADVEEDEEDKQVNEKTADEINKPINYLQQQPKKDQIQQENVAQSPQLPITTIKEESVVDAPSVVAQRNQHGNNMYNKQENLNNTIKDIISNIDSNIQAQENIAALKERELELLKKQQELAREIEQQKILAQKLANENQYKQQLNNSYASQESGITSKVYQPITNVSKYSTFEETQDNNLYSRTSETYETRECTNVSKKIDLHKIFTPATDAKEILPKNRKLYASSAFYSPTLHPTVEDQVELARRISHSLSDISNQQSRGQSMYVNRKKRSVKWVHEGSVQDYHQYQQQPKKSASPSILPAYTDAAKHRVQLNLHQEQLLEKYAKPGLKVVQTPWEAALNSGSASAAFVEEQKLSPFLTATLTPSPTPQIYDASQGGIPIPSTTSLPDSYTKSINKDYYGYQTSAAAPQQQTQHERQAYQGTNSMRELAYKPSIPQGWKAPSMFLPKELYVPKEIPLQSYAPPPVTPVSPYSSSTTYDANQFSTYRPLNASQNDAVSPVAKPYGRSTVSPISKPYQQGFSSVYGNAQPPKQQYLPPQSYQKIAQTTSQNIPQVNFNPSPLPYDKLAKFEDPQTDEGRYANSPCSRVSYLNARSRKVRNTSPAPFATSDNRPFTPSSDGYHYGGTLSISPRPHSATHQYSGHNTPIVTSNQLLNAPSYNTSARGWGCGGGPTSGYHYPQCHLTATKPQVVNASSMPYTDF